MQTVRLAWYNNTASLIFLDNQHVVFWSGRFHLARPGSKCENSIHLLPSLHRSNCLHYSECPSLVWNACHHIRVYSISR